MNMPEFTAEASLYKSRAQYIMTSTILSPANAEIQPQMVDCGRIYSMIELMWDRWAIAVLEGTRGWSNFMREWHKNLRMFTFQKDAEKDAMRLWDAATGRELLPAMRHEDGVGGAAFSRDESRILSWGGNNGTVSLLAEDREGWNAVDPTRQPRHR